jgi:glycosyltransferase 2 family protein
VRPNLSAARGIMRASAGLAASVLERVIDGMVTTGFFAVVLLFLGDRDVPGYVRVGGWSALAVFGGASAFLVVAYLAREKTLAFMMRVLSLFGARVANRVTAMLEGFLLGLSCFKKPTDVLAYLGLTVLYWLLNGLSMWVLMRGLGLDLPILAAFFCLCFLVIGMMMPAPPGNVGNFHAFARAALTIFGVGIGPAVAYAILLHAATTLAVVLWMLVFFATRDLTMGGLRKAASSTSNEKPEATATPDTPR